MSYQHMFNMTKVKDASSGRNLGKRITSSRIQVKFMLLLTSRVGIVYRSYKVIPRREVNLMQAYCMKCRKKVDIKNPKTITMKNGRPATQGECPSCGTKVFRIGKS